MGPYPLGRLDQSLLSYPFSRIVLGHRISCLTCRPKASFEQFLIQPHDIRKLEQLPVDFVRKLAVVGI
jgi:hypothetical protein